MRRPVTNLLLGEQMELDLAATGGIDARLSRRARLLEQSAVPFAAITSLEDFHLSVFHLESFCAEVIFDLDYRDGRAVFHRSSFNLPHYGRLSDADVQNWPRVSVPVRRVSTVLTANHRLVRMVRDEHVFRMTDGPCQMLDGTQFSLIHSHASGNLRLESWQPCGRPSDAGWLRLLDAVAEADTLLSFCRLN